MKGQELNSMIFLGPFQIRIFSDSMRHKCAANRGLGEFGVPYQSKNLSIKLVFALCFIKTSQITRYCYKREKKSPTYSKSERLQSNERFPVALGKIDTNDTKREFVQNLSSKAQILKTQLISNYPEETYCWSHWTSLRCNRQLPLIRLQMLSTFFSLTCHSG